MSNKFIDRKFEIVQGGNYENDFYYTPDGSFWDPDGFYFNKDGYDKHSKNPTNKYKFFFISK